MEEGRGPMTSGGALWTRLVRIRWDGAGDIHSRHEDEALRLTCNQILLTPDRCWGRGQILIDSLGGEPIRERRSAPRVALQVAVDRNCDRGVYYKREARECVYINMRERERARLRLGGAY